MVVEYEGSLVWGLSECKQVGKHATVVTLGKDFGFSVYGKGYGLWVRCFGLRLGLRLGLGFRVGVRVFGSWSGLGY